MSLFGKIKESRKKYKVKVKEEMKKNADDEATFKIVDSDDEEGILECKVGTAVPQVGEYYEIYSPIKKDDTTLVSTKKTLLKKVVKKIKLDEDLKKQVNMDVLTVKDLRNKENGETIEKSVIGKVVKIDDTENVTNKSTGCTMNIRLLRIGDDEETSDATFYFNRVNLLDGLKIGDVVKITSGVINNWQVKPGNASNLKIVSKSTFQKLAEDDWVPECVKKFNPKPPKEIFKGEVVDIQNIFYFQSCGGLGGKCLSSIKHGMTMCNSCKRSIAEVDSTLMNNFSVHLVFMDMDIGCFEMVVFKSELIPYLEEDYMPMAESLLSKLKDKEMIVKTNDNKMNKDRPIIKSIEEMEKTKENTAEIETNEKVQKAKKDTAGP